MVPDYMPMGSAGMAEMGDMEMPMPDNTLPMMTGFGPFGPIEMVGMFSVVKVREGLAKGDYRDPGPYKNPQGTVSYEWTGVSVNPQRAPTSRATELDPRSGKSTGQREVILNVRKPSGHGSH